MRGQNLCVEQLEDSPPGLHNAICAHLFCQVAFRARSISIKRANSPFVHVLRVRQLREAAGLGRPAAHLRGPVSHPAPAAHGGETPLGKSLFPQKTSLVTTLRWT